MRYERLALLVTWSANMAEMHTEEKQAQRVVIVGGGLVSGPLEPCSCIYCSDIDERNYSAIMVRVLSISSPMFRVLCAVCSRPI